jgi:sugar lactone lactonase YvrE
VEQFDPDGRFLGKHSLGGVDVSVGALQMDRSGNLIVINDKGRVLEKYSPQGTLLVRWVETDADHEPLLWPSSLAIDADDNIYVTDWTRPRVVKYAN